MKKQLLHTFLIVVIAALFATMAEAQNSFPAPGNGNRGSSMPPPGNNSLMTPSGPGWGNPWNNAWNSPIPPGMPAVNTPGWQNTGTMSVLGCGYDAQGVWRVIPMSVSYNYNGIQYNVTVINAWDPWFRQWDYDVDVPAVNTTYLLRGTYYNFYVVLSTGTFYFNL